MRSINDNVCYFSLLGLQHEHTRAQAIRKHRNSPDPRQAPAQSPTTRSPLQVQDTRQAGQSAGLQSKVFPDSNGGVRGSGQCAKEHGYSEVQRGVSTSYSSVWVVYRVWQGSQG